MGIVYSKDETLKAFSSAMENWEELYKSDLIKRTGKVLGGSEYHTDIYAQKILEHLDDLIQPDKIGVIARDEKKFYKQEHPMIAFEEDRLYELKKQGKKLSFEKHKARSLQGKSLQTLGTVIDYQTPLYKEKRTEEGRTLGEVDLLSNNQETNTVYMIEFKWKTNKETLFRCILEIYTYWRTIPKDRLLKDFCICSSAKLRKVVLVYDTCLAYKEYKSSQHLNVRKLMTELGVELAVIDEHDQVRFE